MFVAIEGGIAAGKSTLAEYLTKDGEFFLMPEPFEKCLLLPDFYKDPKRYAALVQLWMLHQRYADHQEAKWMRRDVVQDRSIFGDTAFAHNCWELGLMTDAELELYLLAFRNMMVGLAYPDVVIYLDVSPEEAVRRIKTRGREMEQNIEPGYIANLTRWYQALRDELRFYTNVFTYPWDKPDMDKVKTDLKKLSTRESGVPRWAKLRPWDGRLKL